MTNEEAIKHFEGKTSYSNRDDFEMGDSEAKYLALSALREQAERGKGCLYCAGYEAEFMLPIIEMSENTANSLEIDGNFAYVHCHCGRHTVGKINFCPMCGRRLEAQHE